METLFSLQLITTIWPLGLTLILGAVAYHKKKGNIGIVIAAILSFLLLIKADLIGIPNSFSSASNKVTWFIILGMLLSLILTFRAEKAKHIAILTGVLSVLAVLLIGYKSVLNATMNDEGVFSSLLWLVAIAIISLLTIRTTLNAYKHNILQAVVFIAITITYGTLFLFDDLGTSSATLYTFGSILGGYCLLNWIIFKAPLGNISPLFNLVIVAVVGQSMAYDREDLTPLLFILTLIMIFVPDVVSRVMPRFKFIKSQKTQQFILPIVVGGVCLIIGGIIMGYAHFMPLDDGEY